MLDKFNINVYIYPQCSCGDNNSINLKLQQIMANITELIAQVDDLQTALDTEQEQIAAAIAALQQSVTDLQAMVADGGTAEQRQALADKLTAIKTDLEGTIPDVSAPTT